MINQENDYLFYNKKFPVHFSVGAVVLDSDNRLMCHHFDKIDKFQELYILMRETLEPDESIEQTLARGLQEEFGASAKIVHYLGSVVSHHADGDIPNIEKTTLYFLCKLIDFNPEKRAKDDPEFSSEIQFLSIDELKEKMKSQSERYPERTDLDERAILDRVAKAIDLN